MSFLSHRPSVITTAAPVPRAQVFAFRGRTQLRMGRRRNELARLLEFRRQYGVELVDRMAWSLAIADALSFKWSALDLVHMRDEAARIGFHADDETMLAAVRRTCALRARKGPDYRPMHDTLLGRVLDVTLEERLYCEITTIGTIDETPDERHARVAEERKERDRVRKRLSRQKAREAKKLSDEAAISKSVRGPILDLSSSDRGRPDVRPVSQTRPWERQGIGRSTWYRRRKASLAQTESTSPCPTPANDEKPKALSISAKAKPERQERSSLFLVKVNGQQQAIESSLTGTAFAIQADGAQGRDVCDAYPLDLRLSHTGAGRRSFASFKINDLVDLRCHDSNGGRSSDLLLRQLIRLAC